ncbi:hypothetical protein AOLI_G00028050 [Acnodon oligacanthus]
MKDSLSPGPGPQCPAAWGLTCSDRPDRQVNWVCWSRETAGLRWTAALQDWTSEPLRGELLGQVGFRQPPVSAVLTEHIRPFSGPAGGSAVAQRVGPHRSSAPRRRPGQVRIRVALRGEAGSEQRLDRAVHTARGAASGREDLRSDARRRGTSLFSFSVPERVTSAMLRAPCDLARDRPLQSNDEKHFLP